MLMSISLTNYLLCNIMQQQNKLPPSGNFVEVFSPPAPVKPGGQDTPACDGLSVSAGKSTTEKPSKQRRGCALVQRKHKYVSVSTVISILNGREIVNLITLVPCVNLKVRPPPKKELLFVYSFKKRIENHAQISYSSMTMRSQITECKNS